MDIHSLIQTRRSIRKFKQEQITIAVLKQICDDSRFTPSPGNLQPWEFLLVYDTNLTNEVFHHLEWLGGPPMMNERPVAYLVLLYPAERKDDWSCLAGLGACCQNILLSAWAYGIGSCWIGSIRNSKKLRNTFRIPDNLNIFSIIALGYPAEEPVIEPGKDTLRPQRDESGTMHIPKKNLQDILHINYYNPRD